MNSTRTSFLLGVILLLWGRSARAETVVQDFEKAKNPFFRPLSGRNLTRTHDDVSTADISQEAAHSGTYAARLKYRLNDEGRLNITVIEPFPIGNLGDTLYFSMWVRGSGQRDFKEAYITMMDNATEDFALSVPGLVEALGAKTWTQVRGSWKKSELEGRLFNPNRKLLLPLYWLGWTVSQNGKQTTQGTVFFDDVRFSDAPIAQEKDAPETPTPSNERPFFNIYGRTFSSPPYALLPTPKKLQRAIKSRGE